MDKWEIGEGELAQTRAEAAVIDPVSVKGDFYNIRRQLMNAIAKFCDCRCWGDPSAQTIEFCGLRPDVELAKWLLESLTRFCEAELARYLQTDFSFEPIKLRKQGFYNGVTSRISQRLRELAAQRRPATAGQALVVVKTELIANAMRANGVKLTTRHRAARAVDGQAIADGKAAGDRASFGRPVGAGGAIQIGESK